MKISVLIPSLRERAKSWLPRAVGLYRERTQGCEVEVISGFEGASWGEGINWIAPAARGDYLLLTSDDMWPTRADWWEPAVDALERGFLPAPRIVNPDGSLQSCGKWREEQDDWEPTEFSVLLFVSRDLWERIGPVIHTTAYADYYLTDRARAAGFPAVVRRGFEFVHAYAQEGRRSDDRTLEEHRIYLETVAA